MRPRQDISELFSTFIHFEKDYFKSWSTDPKLRRSIQNCLESVPNAPASDTFWVLYWHKVWQSQPSTQIAAMHLSAYLQEPCYWAVKQTMAKFVSTQNQLPDYFQTAIAEIHQILIRYNPDKYPSLKLYASLVFSTILRDMLRQRQETDLCTDWALLRKVGRKRFMEALQNLGLSSSTIAQYQLAWICFKELYAQSSFNAKSALPTQELWVAVADLYNAERQNQLDRPSPQVSSEVIQQWLTNCAKSIRSYLYPSVRSLNITKSGQESGEIQDDLPNHLTDLWLTDLVIQEDAQTRQVQQNQVGVVLSETLQRLDEQSQHLLHLYYRLNLNQKQMAKESGLSQATISRRLTQAKKDLLTALVQWSQQTLNISPTSTIVIDMGIALEDWLKICYGKLSFALDTDREEKTE